MTRSSHSSVERQRLCSVRSPALDRLTEADGRFFARFPGRRTRVRLAGRAEIEAVAGADAPALLRELSGLRLAIVVRWVAPGSMVSAFVPVPNGANLDVSETEAAAIFAVLTGHQTEVLDLLKRALQDDATKSGERL